MAEIEIRVSDLRQYHYCPRVVYYQFVMPVDHKATYKMEKGKSAQAEIEVLEKRRKLKSYGLADGERLFGQWVKSHKLGLTGKPDLVIKTEIEIFPVDFKYTRGRPRRNHLYQLGGYALILEEKFQKPVKSGFIYLIPQKDAVVFPLTGELKQDCLRMVDEIRQMIEREIFPPAPVKRSKCTDCEYQNYCRDIW
ncbi:MAG: CRISPR-associated protein Cas4 [Desulfobacterales bacterium]|nr:CRISPR-associated protein Cas4 [Desulfobacterales bacterium]